MADLKELKIDAEVGLGARIEGGPYAVPRYQRAYKWQEKQITDLLYDIENAISEDQSEYFLGSIVIAKNDDTERPEIVDGQQRLATATIFLASLRDYFIVHNDKDSADIIQQKYLFTRELRTKEVLPKLQLSEVDHEFFRKKILEPPSANRDEVAATRESHRRILEASRIASEYLSHIVSGMKKPEEHLFDRIAYLHDKVRVIWVRVPDYSNAFTIFETLNDRGITLAITDLLKNYLFHRSGDRIKEAQQFWVEMFTIIETAVDEETVKDYIRHHWSSHNGLTRERELYKDIKEKVANKATAVGYAENLRDEARLFAALANSNHEFWTGYSSSTRQHVETIDLLGMERITPLLLAVLHTFDSKNIQRTLKAVVCWGVRLLVAGGVAGALEKRYSEAALKIRQKSIKDADDLFAFLRDVIPGDKDFHKAFASARVSKPKMSRYYLQVLERQKLGEKEPEFVPNPNEAEINLEHVLPQNPALGTWKAFPTEERLVYTNRLGNLALMKLSENKGSGNEEFEDKKKAYESSSFALTKQIAGYKEWNPTNLDDRQVKLSDLAVSAWPLKP